MNPRVGIIMGSDSDLKVMQAAADILQQFNVPHEVTVVSAHRTPERMREYAQSARNRGLQVIIAGAGGAAHLPGMVASLTTLPVIGVPIKSSNSIDGMGLRTVDPPNAKWCTRRHGCPQCRQERRNTGHSDPGRHRPSSCRSIENLQRGHGIGCAQQSRATAKRRVGQSIRLITRMR